MGNLMHGEYNGHCSGFPLGLENLGNGKVFYSQGKVREFGRDWKSQGNSHKILENSEFQTFLVIFK